MTEAQTIAIVGGGQRGFDVTVYEQAAPAALAAYEAARRPRTSRIQLHARERGKINNAPSAFQRFKRDLGYRLNKLIRPREHTYSIEWIYGHDVTATRDETPKAA